MDPDPVTSARLYAATRQRVSTAADSGTHEADLHGLLGIGRPPEELWMAALDWALPDPRPSDDVPGTLSIVIPDRMYEVGTGKPVAQVHTSAYELFRAVFERHRESFSRYFDCTHAMHACLARTFVSEPGYTSYYDSLAPGLTRWLHDLIFANASAHGVDPETATWG